MDILHKFILGGEITATAIAALITLSVLLASIRAIFSKGTPPFDPVAGVLLAEQRAAVEGWPHRILVAFDVFLNVVVLFGFQSETISSHCYRASLEGKLWGKLMTKWLDGFQPNHGPLAASGDLQRSQSEVTRLRALLKV